MSLVVDLFQSKDKPAFRKLLLSARVVWRSFTLLACHFIPAVLPWADFPGPDMRYPICRRAGA